MASIQIERMEAMEKRLGVSIKQVNGRVVDDDDFQVIFELKILNGGQLRETMKVVILIYNHAGELIARDDDFFQPEKVFAFTSGSVYFSNFPADDVKKIVIYPELF